MVYIVFCLLCLIDHGYIHRMGLIKIYLSATFLLLHECGVIVSEYVFTFPGLVICDSYSQLHS